MVPSTDPKKTNASETKSVVFFPKAQLHIDEERNNSSLIHENYKSVQRNVLITHCAACVGPATKTRCPSLFTKYLHISLVLHSCNYSWPLNCYDFNYQCTADLTEKSLGELAASLLLINDFLQWYKLFFLLGWNIISWCLLLYLVSMWWGNLRFRSEIRTERVQNENHRGLDWNTYRDFSILHFSFCQRISFCFC